MSEFIVDFQRQDHYHAHKAMPVYHQSDEFVAHFRKSYHAPSSLHHAPSSLHHAPSSLHHAPSSELLSPFSDSHMGSAHAVNHPFSPNPHMPSSPESCHSPMPPPSITGSEVYSDEDVLDMISVKQLSKRDVGHHLERSLLQLTEKMLHGRRIDRIEGALTIRLTGDSAPLRIQLNRTYDDDKKTLTDSETDETMRMHVRRCADSPRSVASDEWMGTLSPESCLRADSRYLSQSPAAHSPRLLCPEEGDRVRPTEEIVVDNNVPDLQSLLSTEVQIRGDQKCSSQSESRVEESRAEIQGLSIVINADDADDGTESALVIDIPSDSSGRRREASEMEVSQPEERQEMREESFRESSTDRDVSMESESESVPCTSSSSDSFSDPDDSDDSSNSRSSSSSAKTARLTCEDTASPEEAPGDSGRPRDPAVAPHSLAAKMVEGIMCKCCREVLPDPATLVQHAQDKHDMYCCSVCFKTFTAKNNLKRHVRLHTGQRPFKCSQCHQKFARRDDLKGHMLRHDYSKPFRCNLCQKGYTDKACVKNHMTREHGSRRLIVCPQCGESFDNDDAFSTHKTSHPELRKFSCKDCPFIGTNKLMTMKHKLIHTHKLFSCKPCNAYFPDPFNYTSHVRTHKVQTAFRFYKCCFCDILLPTYEQFVRHEYSHAQGKTHSCSVCNKQFNSRASVQEHALSHKEEEVAQENKEVEQSVQEQEPNVQENVNVNAKEESQTPARPIPVIVLNEAETSSPQEDLVDDGVLDLSMKRSLTPTPRVLSAEVEQQTPSSDVTAVSGQLSGPSDYSVPRNGCAMSGPPAVVEMADTVRAKSLHDASLKQTMSTIFKPFTEITGQNVQNIQSGAPHRPAFPTRMDHRSRVLARHASTEEIYSDETSKKSPFLLSSLSKGDHPRQGRYDPYKTTKMAEFAQKFFSARGHHANLLGKERQALNSFFPDSGEKSRRHFPESNNNNISDNRMDSMRLKAQECDTLDNSHLPTFIKTETFLEADKSSVDCRRSPNVHQEDPSLRMSARGPAASDQTRQVCGQCKDEFKSFPELELHSAHVHKRYLCEYCGKSFSARPNRDRHVRYHTGERPFKCDLCDQAFFRGDDLKYHRTTRHPSAQPAVCNRCSASFTWKKDLERHIRQSKCKLDMTSCSNAL